MIALTDSAKLIAGVALVAGIALVTANTYRLSAAVDRAELKASQCAETNRRLQESLDEQNERVVAMEKASADAQERAVTALAEAAAAERSRQIVQARLVAFQRREGEGECDAARRIIQEYRR